MLADPADRAVRADRHPGDVVEVDQRVVEPAVHRQRQALPPPRGGDEAADDLRVEQMVGHQQEEALAGDLRRGDHRQAVGGPPVGVAHGGDRQALAVGQLGQEGLERLGLIAGDHDEVGRPAGVGGLDHPLDQRHAEHGRERFGACDLPEPGALPRGDDDAVHSAAILVASAMKASVILWASSSVNCRGGCLQK